MFRDWLLPEIGGHRTGLPAGQNGHSQNSESSLLIEFLFDLGHETESFFAGKSMNCHKTGAGFETCANCGFHGRWDVEEFAIDKDRCCLGNLMYQRFSTLIG